MMMIFYDHFSFYQFKNLKFPLLLLISLHFASCW
jgi:hypothetical protein